MSVGVRRVEDKWSSGIRSESGRGSSPVQGCWSSERSGVWSPGEVRVQCRAVGRVAAGERSPAGPETVRATLRSERALKRASTLKEQGPFTPLRRRRLGPIDQAAWQGLDQPSRHYTSCRVDDETSRVAQRVTTRVAGNLHGLAELLRSSQLRGTLKAYGPCSFFLFWGFAWKLWRLVL